jgi:hypothetical protein
LIDRLEEARDAGDYLEEEAQGAGDYLEEEALRTEIDPLMARLVSKLSHPLMARLMRKLSPLLLARLTRKLSPPLPGVRRSPGALPAS